MLPPLSRSNHGVAALEEQSLLLWGCPKPPLHPPALAAQQVVAAAPSSSNRKKVKDDYHGTLHALQSKRRVPKKWLGQHYMVNQEINEKIVDVANIKKDDLIVEIGPGTGALTNYLVEAGAYVIAVEKDLAMAELVFERFHKSGCVEVIQEDFMKWPIRSSMEHMKEMLSGRGMPMRHAKVVSNLPFNITTPVVKRILPMGDMFSSMVLLLQDEAASRLIDAIPHDSNYRPVSLFVQFFSDARCELKVGRSNFFPCPKVDAAVVSFEIKQEGAYPSVSSARSFFTLVNSAFAGKRKMLRNSLQAHYSSTAVREALKTVNLLDTARPDELTLHQFVALYNALEADKLTTTLQDEVAIKAGRGS